MDISNLLYNRHRMSIGRDGFRKHLRMLVRLFFVRTDANRAA